MKEVLTFEEDFEEFELWKLIDKVHAVCLLSGLHTGLFDNTNLRTLWRQNIANSSLSSALPIIADKINKVWLNALIFLNYSLKWIETQHTADCNGITEMYQANWKMPLSAVLQFIIPLNDLKWKIIAKGFVIEKFN